jgi:hypothetical protein
MAECKASSALDLVPSLAEALVLVPRPLVRMLTFAGSGTVQLIVTNVPGIMMPRYLAGSRMVAGHPFAPLAPQCPVSIALYGDDGRLFVGIDADGTAMPDVDRFAAALRAAFEEIVAAAARHRSVAWARPIAPNTDENGRSLNRRVEVACR